MKIKLCLSAIVLGAIAAALVAATPSGKTAGAGCSITNAELEKIPLDSVMDPPAVEGAMVFPDSKSAVWLTAGEFREGQVVPAWLAVKSLAHEPQRGVALCFDLGVAGEKVRLDGTARLQLARVSPGSPEQILADVQGQVTRTTKRLLIPPGGFAVNAGDVRNLTGGKLAPGDYRLRFWAEGQRSESRFRITPAPAAAAPATAPAALPAAHESAILQWIGGWDTNRGRRRGAAAAPAADANKWTLKDGNLCLRPTDEFERGLSLGVGSGPQSRHFARLADLPQEDDILRIDAKFVSGQRDHIEITLSPARDAGAATAAAAVVAAAAALPTYPQVYFLVENLGPPVHRETENDFYGNNAGGKIAFASPILMDVELPEEWSYRTGFTKKVRITVIIASDVVRPGVERPYGDNSYGNGETEPAVRDQRWVGAVKSAPMEVTIKPPQP